MYVLDKEINKRISLCTGKQKNRYKKIKMGLIGNFKVNAYGQHLEVTLPQFVLKVENRSIYDCEYRDLNGNKGNENNYDLYISPDVIRNSDFKYIEYMPSKHLEHKLSLEECYNKALKLRMEFDISINILIYDGFCLYLDKRYINPENRKAFKSIEHKTLERKYTYSYPRRTKTGLTRAQKLENSIIREVMKCIRSNQN